MNKNNESVEYIIKVSCKVSVVPETNTRWLFVCST